MALSDEQIQKLLEWFSESSKTRIKWSEKREKSLCTREKGVRSCKLNEISRQMATIDLAEVVEKGIFSKIGKAGKGIAYQMTQLTNK